VQAISISIAAWPIYLCVRQSGSSPRQALLWAAVYLFNPFVLNALVWDFHEASLAVPVMGLGLWAVLARRYVLLWCCCLLLMATKEHYGIAAAGFGLLWGIEHKEWKKAGALIGVGIITLVVVLGVVMPMLRNEDSYDLLGSQTSRFEWLKSTQGWRRVLPQLLTECPLYIVNMLIPLCFLPVAGLLWLLPAMADFAVILLSEDPLLRLELSYHSVTIIPVMVFAAYRGSLWLQKKKFPLSQKRLAYYVLCFSVGMGWLMAPFPLPMARNIWETDKLRLHMGKVDAQAIHDIRRLLPPDALIQTQSNIEVWFSDDPLLFMFPYASAKAEYTVLYLAPIYAAESCMRCTPSGVYYQAELDRLFTSPGWGVLYWRYPWLVMQRGVKDSVSRRDVMQAYEKFASGNASIPAMQP
jgi:hypothetical protein